MEIVKLIGADVLPDDQKLVIETARVIRVGFLQQNAYHKDDTYVPLDKQFKMMKIIIQLYDNCRDAVNQGVPFSKLLETGMFERVIKMKYDIPNDKSVMDDRFTDLSVDIDQAVKNVVKQCTEEGR